MGLFNRENKDPIQGLNRLRHAAAQARLPYERDWWLNLAFYLDYQYVEWQEASNVLRPIPRDKEHPNTPRPVVNKIMHFVSQEHASVLKTKPTVDVLPATDDPTDASTAQVALAYLRYLAEAQVGDFDTALSEAALWALLPGEGYIKWLYNGRLKRPDFMSVSPFDLYIDPYAVSFAKARYAIHSQFMDVEQVYDLYGKEVKPNDVQKSDPTKSALLREMGQAPVLTGATVNELWLLPCRRHPQGLFAVWTDREMLVEPQPYPYDHKRLPFTQIGSTPRPGTPHFTSAVKYLRSPQMELNKYHAQRISMREAFANLKWWIPSELEMESDPNDATRQILRGNSGAMGLKPEIIAPPSLPTNDDGAWLEEGMMHVVGLHEVSQAQVPGRVEAAKAIELLKEADDGRLAPMLHTIKTAISEGYWQLLMLTKQYVPGDQIIQTYTREGMPEVKRFKGEDFKPGLRVQVTMGTGLARSRAARQDQLMLMWQNQIITDPETMAELLEVPVPTFVSQRIYDIRLARNENYTLSEGSAIVPNSWDDHEIHLREHNNFRKTQEFLQLDPERKKMFEHHCQLHEDFQMQALMKQAQKQQVMMAAQTMAMPSGAQTVPGDPQSQNPSQATGGKATPPASAKGTPGVSATGEKSSDA